MTRVHHTVAALAFLATLTAAAPAHAHDPWIGLRVGYYDFGEEKARFIDQDGASIGLELLFRVAHRVYFNPNVDYVFVDGGKEATFNADFHYDFRTHSRTMVWAGAGVGLVWVDPDGRFESDTDIAANFLLGVGYNGHGVIPYLQGKFVATRNPGFQVAVGLRF